MGKRCDEREILDLRREVTTGGMRRLEGGEQLKIEIIENISTNVQLSSHCRTHLRRIFEVFFSPRVSVSTAGCNIPGFPSTGDGVSGQRPC